MNSIARIFTGAGLAVALGFTVSAQGADLIDVYQLATHNDPQVRAAEAQRLADYEAKSQGRAQLLPFVTFDAAYDRIYDRPDGGSNSDYNISTLSLSLVQPIYHREVSPSCARPTPSSPVPTRISAPSRR